MNTLTVKEPKVFTNTEVAAFLGKVFSFNNSLKLSHWHVTGVGSYAQHIALDEAIASLLNITDRLVETAYAMCGDLNIEIPITNRPTALLTTHCEGFYKIVEMHRELFAAAFIQSIIDDYQEAVQQLLYRLKRLQ